MKLPALLTTDLHLAAGDAAEYRFGIFPWLANTVKRERVMTVNILGDLTDAKDNHGAELVNRVVQCVRSLAETGVAVNILAGNHDWLRKGHEFFKFLGLIPGVRFITKPSEDEEFLGPSAFFLPYSKDPARDWAGLDFTHYNYLFMHQTVSGSVSSNGQKMEGERLPVFQAGKIYSGDIHVPQVVGAVEYVGSPYHVHMGDAFKPRCVLIGRDQKARDLHFETISRVTVSVSGLRDLGQQRFKEGDQVKVRIELPESEKHDWSRLRREALANLLSRGVEVVGIEMVLQKSARRAGHRDKARLLPEHALMAYVEAEGLSGSALDAGLKIIGA